MVQQIIETLRNDLPALMSELLENAAGGVEEQEKLGEIVQGELTECESLAGEYR